MRRGSVIGPLILILIGGVFLVNNIRPDLSVAEMLTRYWPFLLILWGGLRLIEVLAGYFRTGTVPVRGVSGGEWVAVVFICLIGSGAFFFRRHAGIFPPTMIRMRGVEMFGEPFDYSLEEKRTPAGKTPRVIIENFRGNARVIGSATDEVRVNGRKTIRAMQRSDADKAHEATPLEVIRQGDTVTIRSNQHRASDERHISADLDISVPSGASVEARGRYGDFDIGDLTGNVEVNSDNAGVRVQNVAGSVRIDLRKSDIIRAVNIKGQVELKGRGENIEMDNIAGPILVNGSYFGDLQFRKCEKPLRYEGPQAELRIESIPGEVRMARSYLHGQNVVGPVFVQAKTKDVQFTEFTNGLNVSLDRGDIELRPVKTPISKMEVRTRSGDILLAVPPAAKFDLRAITKKGEVENDFGESVKMDTDGRQQTMSMQMPDGAPVILETDRGVIVLRKGNRDLAPVPPPPPRPRRPVE